MAISDILSQIDREIAALQQARALLTGTGRSARKPGSSGPKAPAAKKHRLSPEGRKRIADAVKRRWAEHRKAAGKK